MFCCLAQYDRQNMYEKRNSSVAANFQFLLLRAREDPLFFTMFFIDFVKTRLDNKGKLFFGKWQIGHQSLTDLQFFGKSDFPYYPCEF